MHQVDKKLGESRVSNLCGIDLFLYHYHFEENVIKLAEMWFNVYPTFKYFMIDIENIMKITKKIYSKPRYTSYMYILITQ